MTEQLPDGTESEEFWMGWLVATAASTLRRLEQLDENGAEIYSREDVIEHLRRCWRLFADSEVGRANATVVEQDDRSYAGFVVENAHGEAQALREAYAGAHAALDQTYMHWDEVDTSSNPDADEFVGSLYPFRIRQVTRAEWNTILENGTPILDREA